MSGRIEDMEQMNKFLKRFTVYDLVIMAVMAALGIAVKPIVVPLAHAICGPLMIPGGAVAGGFYMMWIVIAYGIVGKPGTAALTALIQALLVMFTGIAGSHGIMSLLTYAAPGIVMDLALLLIRHRACCRGCCAIGGAAANLTGTLCVNLVFFQAPDLYLAVMIGTAVLSGAIGGLLAWELLKIMKRYHMLGKGARTPGKNGGAKDDLR